MSAFKQALFAVVLGCVSVAGAAGPNNIPPLRIVTLAPSLAEVVSQILPTTEWSRVVGVSEYTDTPEEFKKKPSIGSYARFNLEKVLSLKPDLILATADGNSLDQVKHLEELGVKVVSVTSTRLAPVADGFEVIGAALGFGAKGQELAKQFRDTLLEFKKRATLRVNKARPKPRWVVVVSEKPLIVVGGSSFLDDAMQILGVQNAYGNMPQAYPQVAIEDLVQKKPEKIVVLTMNWSGGAGADLKSRGLPTQTLESDSVMRPSMRFLDGLKEMEKLLQ